MFRVTSCTYAVAALALLVIVIADTRTRSSDAISVHRKHLDYCTTFVDHPFIVLYSQDVNMPHSKKVLVEHWKDRTNTRCPDEVEDGFVTISDEATAEWVYFLLFLIYHVCRSLASDTFPGR